MGSTLNGAGQLQASVSGSMQTLYNRFPFIKNAYKQKQPKQTKDPKRMTKKEREQAVRDSVARAKNPDSVRRAQVAEALTEVGNFAIRMVTGLKNFSVQYSRNTGSLLPGYMGSARILGMDPRNGWMPGPAFVVGYNDGLVERLRESRLLSTDTLMNSPHRNTLTQMMSLQATVEPIRDFRIEITASQNNQSRGEDYYKFMIQLDEC